MSISVVGLGKLGLCTATCFANAGIEVIGYDNDSKRISALEGRECYIDEPGLKEGLQQAFIEHQLSVTDNIEDIVKNTNQTFIIVPTPSDESGAFSNFYIMDVLSKMCVFLKSKKEHHIINIVSTVMPGSCGKFTGFVSYITGKKEDIDFSITYNPEFIALGSVMHDFRNPDMVLIGGTNQQAIQAIAKNYEKFSNNIQSMPTINAEITKLALNCFLTTKISFINEIATICEMTPGANIDDVSRAIGYDSRVGHSLLKAGLGFMGPCLPRDNIAMSVFAQQRGYSTKLPQAVVDVNNGVVGRILSRVLCHADKSDIIDIYGTSYKSGTKLTDCSQSIILKNQLEQMGYFVRTFEGPIVYGDVKYPRVIILMSDSINLDIHNILNLDTVFIDPWRKYSEANKICIYYGLGINYDR